MDLIIIIGVPVFILYTVIVFAFGNRRGYNAGFDDAKMIFLANETEWSESDEDSD